MSTENQEFGDAYQGAREDLSIWKRRALEAEAKVREQDQIIERLGNALNEENGPVRMGEPLIAAPVVERQPVAVVRKVVTDISTRYEGVILASAIISGLVEEGTKLYTSPPASVQHPFADKVIRKLQRFQECTDDGQGADIGRHWFDILTQLGLLNRVQRSPALWEMTQQGEDCIDKVKELNQ